MGEKATATVGHENALARSAGARTTGSSRRIFPENSFASLQQTLGNQTMLQLLESGTIRAKLRVSQPGDSDEIEADRVAEKVVAASRAPIIHRKCACGGGTPCAKCAGDQDEQTIHRSVVTPQLHSLEPSIQRAPTDPTSTADPAPAVTDRQPPRAKTSGSLVVEDNATKVEQHQMRKSQFIALLRTEACAAADAALASVRHSTRGCPYVAKWLSFYEKQSSDHIEQAIRKYAAEAAQARSAREAIHILVTRIERAAILWAKTGKIEGVPKELASQVLGQGGVSGSNNSFVNARGGGDSKGSIGATKKQDAASSGAVQRKANNGDAAPAHNNAAGVRAQLGRGQPLDSRVQSHMSTAFGHDFSGVRVHSDSIAAKLSSDLQARAFTVGNDVAFASGEYRPGTLIGDALIAHELAHVVQQSEGIMRSAPPKGEPDTSALEDDAEASTIRAVTSSLDNTEGGIDKVSRNAIPTLKSGLQLQRCASGRPRTPVLPLLEGAKTGCDVISGRPRVTYPEGVHENVPECLLNCLEVHEQVHVRQQTAECLKLSAAYRKARDASNAEKANPTPETTRARNEAIVEYKKAIDYFWKNWLPQNRPKHEIEAYKASLACAQAPAVEQGCRAEGRSQDYERELNLWRGCAQSPDECINR